MAKLTNNSSIQETAKEFQDEVYDSIVTSFGATAEVMRNYSINIGNGLKRRVDIAVRQNDNVYLIETYTLKASGNMLVMHLPERLQKVFTYATLSYDIQHQNSKLHPILAINVYYEPEYDIDKLDDRNISLRADTAQNRFERNWDRFNREMNAIISIYGIDNVDSILLDKDDLNNPEKLRAKFANAPTLQMGQFNLKQLPEKKHEVFISYRRTDSAWAAGRLADHLKNKFKEDDIFFDTRNIGLGENFVEAIQRQINASNVLLAIIGETWLTVSDTNSGRRRLDDPDDYVRLEIATALENDLNVIPILIDGANMPSAQYLPKGLEDLAFRNAGFLSASSFHTDVTRIVGSLIDAGVPTKRSRSKKSQ